MKILIVEDERELAKSMVQYLRQESYVCEMAHTAQEAIEKVSLQTMTAFCLTLPYPMEMALIF